MKNLLFVGGGHSHALALLSLARCWPPDVSPILISKHRFAAYSGMLPGHIAGQFSRDECFIDLAALCAHAGVRWLESDVIGIDAKAQSVSLADGGTMDFAVLSINVGGAQKPLFAASAAAVKPVEDFLSWLDTVPQGESFAVIGAGAGGVETALALSRRLGNHSLVSLIGEEFLPRTNIGVRRRLRRALQKSGIALYEAAAADYQNGAVLLADGGRVTAAHLIYATPVCAPPWLATSGVAVDADGFLRVNKFLQSESHPHIFAAGDCASSGAPKSGVVAVRQAPILARNIMAAVTGEKLTPWPQRKNLLYILNTADGSAVAGWGNFCVDGGWVWQWKKWLDTRFMNRFAVRPNAHPQINPR